MNAPRTGRWVPARAGILNLWRYYEETFAFHNGRLLLRGPNGSGKSKALELLLPFLIDADMRAHRLSTFGTGSHRTMHWNLMGEGATGATRVGYLWLEFALEGTDETFTCGVRLQASKHSTEVKPRYFTTTARVGVDLSLVNDANQPLTPRELAAALEGRGGIFDRAEYRDRIRRRLYPGLNPQRYEALIRAMLQLRTPKLSELLDPKTLSDMLSNALPPMDETELEGIADGFERLDRRRAHLEGLAAQREAATDLDGYQRRYARVLLRTAADRATAAEAARDRAGSKAAELQRGIEECAEAVAGAERLEAEAERGIRSATAERDQLARNPLFDTGRQLKTENEKLRQLEKAQAKAVKRAAKANEAAARLAGEADRAAVNARDRTAAARESRATAIAAAETVGLTGAVHAAAAADPGEELRTLRSAIRDQRDAVTQVRDAATALEGAEDKREEAEQRRERLRERHRSQESTVSESKAVLRRAVEHWADAVDDWAAAATELGLADADREALLADPEDPAAANPILDRAYRARAESLLGEQARLDAALGSLETEREDAAGLLAELERTEQVEPAPARTRAADRTGRPGAPLWRLVDFTGEPDAGLEAALEASGMLDAWVLPDGTLEHETQDTFLSAASESVRTPLSAVLRPEPDAPVPHHVVADLLDRIGHTPANATGTAAVASDGSWRLSGLAGRWSKPAAEFIGAASRRRLRERRIADARERLAECERALAETVRRRDGVASRLNRLRDERDAFPGRGAVDAAQRSLAAAEQTLGLVADEIAAAEIALHEAETRVRAARLEVDRLADRHRLPRTLADLDRRLRQLDEFDTAAAAWSRDRLDQHRAEMTLGELEERSGEARTDAFEAAEEQAEAEGEAAAQRSSVDALERTVGADLRQLQAELDACDERLRSLERQRKNAELELRDLAGRKSELDNGLTTAQRDHETAAAVRDREFDAIRTLLAGQVLSDARIEFPYERSENIKATLEAARRLAQVLETTRGGDQAAASARNRLRDKYHQHKTVLADYAELAFEGEGESELLIAVIAGERIGPRALADRLAFEHDRARTELTDAEQELFGEILTGQIRASLARRIREARELVEGMNTRLERVRTSSGMRVRLRWAVRDELDVHAKAARELLLKAPDKLDAEERALLRAFLSDRVNALRESDDPRPWSEQLKDVFDYTAWHEFHVQFDKGAGWSRLTRRLHSNLSGGEKAVSLHLPLFAALASHYETSPTSPRLLLLDEVLVGVDRANRGQVFELVSALDLDAVLTSEHEWGDYAELDGIAIHQVIASRPGDDLVTTVRYVWDGAARYAEDPEEAHA
ncbi:TIGR02680 family protein [Glycomyces sp. A-F 0318]|uniref:TIGR02680 family protein n=1 Tax=Glycomyces amatae TaxID=2881355 RepID=UPI001E3C8F5B|nr:TIGR02680 family protein [Glycomyces amatae]